MHDTSNISFAKMTFFSTSNHKYSGTTASAEHRRVHRHVIVFAPTLSTKALSTALTFPPPFGRPPDRIFVYIRIYLCVKGEMETLVQKKRQREDGGDDDEKRLKIERRVLLLLLLLSLFYMVVC
jgi:hypothetical protein